MNTNIKSYTLFIILVLGISLLSGCTTTPAIPKPGPIVTGTTGLTYEEYLRTHPPPPLNVQGTLKGEYIELRWDVPKTVTVPHNYSDTITHYKIYRGISTEDMSYVTSTTSQIFKDYNISGSNQYVYEVTAVHDGGVESAPSQEIPVQISGTKDTGLTYEEYLSTHPLPPLNVQGSLKGEYIELRWDAPKTVTVPHSYSDTITHYKIYRGTTTEDMSSLASISGLTFKDYNISGSTRYVYEITAVHDGGVESAPSEGIRVQVSEAKLPGI
jgi:fibronectin type 3 domain-containing protein